MVNKKTMSVHNSAHLFIVNTADVPLTYRSPSAPPVFFFFFSFRLSTKRIELHFDHRLFHSVFKNYTWRKSNKFDINTVWNRAETFRKGEFKILHA